MFNVCQWLCVWLCTCIYSKCAYFVGTLHFPLRRANTKWSIKRENLMSRIWNEERAKRKTWSYTASNVFSLGKFITFCCCNVVIPRLVSFLHHSVCRTEDMRHTQAHTHTHNRHKIWQRHWRLRIVKWSSFLFVLSAKSTMEKNDRKTTMFFVISFLAKCELNFTERQMLGRNLNTYTKIHMSQSWTHGKMKMVFTSLGKKSRKTIWNRRIKIQQQKNNFLKCTFEFIASVTFADKCVIF